MEIQVIQRKWNFIYDQYEIIIDGKKSYTAKSRLFSFYPKIDVYSQDKKKLISVEKKSNDFVKLDFLIRYSLNSYVNINTNSLISYSIRNSSGSINFYEQENNLIGVFLNDLQIGVLDKNKKVILGSDKYDIVIDPKYVDPLLIIGFVLAFDCQYNNDKDSLYFYDHGNVIIDPVLKIDPNWKVQ